jgi:hypothetical protein
MGVIALECKQVLQLFFGRLAEAASHEGTTSPHANLMPPAGWLRIPDNRLKNRLSHRVYAERIPRR